MNVVGVGQKAEVAIQNPFAEWAKKTDAEKNEVLSNVKITNTASGQSNTNTKKLVGYGLVGVSLLVAGVIVYKRTKK